MAEVQKLRRKIMSNVEIRNKAGKLFCEKIIKNGIPYLKTKNCEIAFTEFMDKYSAILIKEK